MLFTETMSISDRFINSLAITILGMVVVFLVLIIIAYSLELLRIIFREKTNKTDGVENIELKEEAVKKPVVLQEEDNSDIIAVIAGAIAAYEGTSSNNIIIKSIKEQPQDLNLWASVGRHQLMTSNYINKKRR